VKNTFDKKHNPMAFVTLEDTEGQAEAVMFSDVLSKNKEHMVSDRVLLLEGKVSCRNGGEGKLLVNSVTPIDDERPPASKEIHLTLDLAKVGEGEIDRIKALLSGNRGDSIVIFHLRDKDKDTCVVRVRSLGIELDYDLLDALCGSVGADNIRLVPGAPKRL